MNSAITILNPFAGDSEDSRTVTASSCYLVLAERVRETADIVRSMEASRIEEELAVAGALETRSNDPSTESFRRSWRCMSLSICYDRGLCRLLNVDYVDLSRNDLQRIALYALYLLRWKPDIVLPVL